MESTNLSPASEISCNKLPQTPPKSPHSEKAKSEMTDKKTATKHKVNKTLQAWFEHFL